MNRREWLQRAAIIAGGVIAADQIELIERLTPKRYVNGWTEERHVYTLAEWAESWSQADKDIIDALRQTNSLMDELLWQGATWPDGIMYGTGITEQLTASVIDVRRLQTLASGT